MKAQCWGTQIERGSSGQRLIDLVTEYYLFTSGSTLQLLDSQYNLD